MMDHLSEDKTTRSRVWLCRTPLLFATAVICMISGLNLYRLISAEAPRNPWEAIEVLEAWRSLNGMPVYELTPEGHSTHMYGALVPWIQGEIFRWVGPNNVSGRVLTLVSALATVTLLAVIVRGQHSAWYLTVAWAAILGVNHRGGQYFAENRPDMPALLFGAIAVVLMAFGLQNRRGLLVVLGSACLIVGFFLKQTVSIFSVVPLVALVLRGKRPTRSDLLLALFPLVATGGVVIGLRVLSPTVYHYMVEVPGAYAVNWPRAAKFLWEFLIDSPLFLLLLGELIISDTRSPRKDPRVFWLLAVLAVTLPFCSVAFAKVGGWPNSMLPALLAMMSFCALRMPVLVRRLENPMTPLHSRLLLGTFLAALLLMSTFPRLTWAKSLIEPASPWNDGYWSVISLTANLPGKVVCPEDPTIPLYAKRYVGQNIFCEKDSHPENGQWPSLTVPEAVVAEFRMADYVVDVTNNYWGDNICEEHLRRFGFEPAQGIPIEGEGYKLWRRKPIDPASGPNRTAFREDSESGSKPPMHW